MDAHTLYTHQSQQAKGPGSTTSNHTIASLPRISNTELSKLVLSKDPSLAIVDVRDSDYVGGHIKGCTNVPSANLDFKLPELVRELGQKEVVVFHCMLSQQRGPMAALRYLRERERLSPKRAEGVHEVKGAEKEAQNEVNDRGRQSQPKEQKVYVLDGGFGEWQEKYGEDGRLTEGYVKDIWQ